MPADAKNTPIYQIGQAIRSMIKDYFYYTRGVYMSLVPYSGKLSIPPERASAWTVAFPKFSGSPSNLKLSALYATSGCKDADLTQAYKTKSLGGQDTLPTTDTPYYWGGCLTGCPIMFRRGTEKTTAGTYYEGSLFSVDSPDSNDKKYLRMNLNPCYASPQSSKCEKACTHFLPNPYYIIEPTADLVKIYEMCGALYPIGDPHNKSNFIFMALEWANNMFQSWTSNPEKSETAGGDNDNKATLGNQSKTDASRKKAVILIVNTPENFEPSELTYLGFKNDASEVLRQSDVIDFSKNYSTGGGETYADGIGYSGHAEGAKKLLYFVSPGTVQRGSSGYYEYTGSNASSCYLQMPQKHTVKLVITPASGSSGSIKFTNIKDKDDTYYKNNTEYTVDNEHTEFFIMSDQINDTLESGMYRIKFDIKNIRFKSAEMTDRTPATTDVNYYTSGTTSGTGTLTITTNCKRSLKLTVKPAKQKAFITLNGTTTELTAKKKFSPFQTGSGVPYSLNNSKISDAYLEDQKSIFNLSSAKNEKWASKNTSSSISNWKDEPTTYLSIIKIKKGKLSICKVYSYWCRQTSDQIEPALEIKVNDTKIVDFPETGHKQTKINTHCNTSQITTNIYGYDVRDGDAPGYAVTHYTRWYCDITYNVTQSSYAQTKLGLSATGGNQFEESTYGRNTMGNREISGGVTITNLERVPFGNTTVDDTKVYLKDGKICFLGDGKLTVEAEPVDTSPKGYVTRTMPDGWSKSKDPFTQQKEITIDPSNYYYKPVGNSFVITLELDNIEGISGLNMENKLKMFPMSNSTAPSISANNNTVLANASLESKTKSICTKLKNAKARIYVIKYRIPSDTTIPAYIDSCATDSGGTVQSADNEAALKTALDAIAIDIRAKDFGNYQNATIN